MKSDPSSVSPLQFKRYQRPQRNGCLSLFDRNSPRYFASNERDDFAKFLDGNGEHYRVAILDGEVVAAFGIISDTDLGRARVNWIMVCPNHQGQGVGRAMMESVISDARNKGARVLDIAASHLSAAFFAAFGAKSVKRTDHGWGPDMHRVDMELGL